MPGAVLALRGMLEWYADPTTPYAKPELTTKRDAPIIVTCASGGRRKTMLPRQNRTLPKGLKLEVAVSFLVNHFMLEDR